MRVQRFFGKFGLLVLVASMALVAASPPGPTPSASPTSAIDLARSRVDQMLRTGHADREWFSSSFLEQVPASRVDEVIATLKESLGEYQSLDVTPDTFVAHFTKGTDDVLIHLDANDKIDSLLFKPPVVAAGSLGDALASLRQGGATLSYVVAGAGSERAALEPSAQLAVASAFKLAVLNALLDGIDRKTRRWSDVVALDSKWKSLPTGVLREWPDGTPLTLATYATEMISISDNTAADALIRIVGAAALAPYAGDNRPFLTTREAFTLKSPAGAALRAAYVAAKTQHSRESVLQRVDSRPLPKLAELAGPPALEIEWHYSIRQLCALMGRVADRPLMWINPGVADAKAFRRVAFKGGSDTGVINLTTAVITKRGAKLCFSATLNNAEHGVNALTFETAYATALSALAAL